MTKRRAPLSYDNALARIAGLIGWAEMARVTDRQERTVRNWGDPDARESCPIDCAEMLDLAFQAAGGQGAPMLETFTLRFDAARAERFADPAQLSFFSQTVAKEAGEAVAALIAAARPGATARDRADALREAEELVTAVTVTLPLLAGSGAAGTSAPGADR